MRQYKHTKQASQKGAFTLIELLVVIVIMMILMGLLMGLIPYIWRSANEAKARAGIEKVHKALQEYMLANGTYPYGSSSGQYHNPGVAGGADLSYMVGNNATYTSLTNWLDKGTNSLVDPWGNGYRYINNNPQGGQTYVLFSMGADKTVGTADDIMSSR